MSNTEHVDAELSRRGLNLLIPSVPVRHKADTFDIIGPQRFF